MQEKVGRRQRRSKLKTEEARLAHWSGLQQPSLLRSFLPLSQLHWAAIDWVLVEHIAWAEELKGGVELAAAAAAAREMLQLWPLWLAAASVADSVPFVPLPAPPVRWCSCLLMCK